MSFMCPHMKQSGTVRSDDLTTQSSQNLVSVWCDINDLRLTCCFVGVVGYILSGRLRIYGYFSFRVFSDT